MQTAGRLDILLVDDKPENLLALEAVLQSPDYRLIKANSGSEALAYLLDHDCAIILLDVQMPEMDGFETASLIKGSERSRNIPIIFITATNNERYVHRGYSAGAVDYLLKPLDPEVLKAKVAVFAELYRSKQEIQRQGELLRESDRRELGRQLAQLELRGLRREQAMQRKYRQLVEGIDHAVIWSADPVHLAFSFVSPSAERILAYPLEQWSTEPGFWAKHLYPEDRERVLKRLEQVTSAKAEVRFEHRFVKASGEVVWLHTGVRMEQRADCEEFELCGLSVDITRQKEVEEALRRSEERFRFLAEANLILSQSFDYELELERVGRLAIPKFADYFVFDLVDEQGNIRPLAASCADPARAEIARLMVESYPPPPGAPDAVWQVIRTGQPELQKHLGDDLRQSTAGGGERLRMMRERGGVRSIVIAPVIARSRTVGAITLSRLESEVDYDEADLLMVQDLARRVAVAIENADLHRKAENAIRARDEFLSIASHELKTPLTPLKLQTQLLIRTLSREVSESSKAEVVARVIQTSDRQVERLSRLVDELLDVSRINVGRLGLNIEELDLSKVVKDVVEQFCNEHLEARCCVELRAESQVVGHWDSSRLEQVVSNLLTNAMKYGGGKPIKISVSKEGSKAKLVVQDQGIGIAQKDQERIFERFERAASPRHFGGLGLGLYITKEIVTSHAGSIRVESELGRGSTFIVELPLEVSPPADFPAERDSGQPERGSGTDRPGAAQWSLSGYS